VTITNQLDRTYSQPTTLTLTSRFRVRWTKSNSQISTLLSFVLMLIPQMMCKTSLQTST